MVETIERHLIKIRNCLGSYSDLIRIMNFGDLGLFLCEDSGDWLVDC